VKNKNDFLYENITVTLSHFLVLELDKTHDMALRKKMQKCLDIDSLKHVERGDELFFHQINPIILHF